MLKQKVGFVFGFLTLAMILLADQTLLGQTPGEQKVMTKDSVQTKAAVTESDLLRPWPGPFGGVPPWNLIDQAEFVDAFKQAISLALADVDQIAQNPAAPTFENTVVALEAAGDALLRLQTVFSVYASNLNLGPMPDIQRVVMPMLSEYEDSVNQNAALFARISAIYEDGAAMEALSASEQRLMDHLYKAFVRNGARLGVEDKQRLSKINTRLASLFTDFSQNVLDDEQDYVTWIDNEEGLKGLPESFVASLQSTAAERANKTTKTWGGGATSGRWAVANTRSAMEPFLTYCDNRALREKVWKTYYNRGDNGDEHDNNAMIAEILKLRAARAKLLGYETHAHWRLEPQMAKSPQAAMDLMMKVWPKAVARVKEEVADMQKIADAEGAGIKIAPWDYRYYAEKVRKAKYDLDFNEVKPYLQLEKLREAMHWCAGELYGLQFRQIHNLPVFHPDVRVWEVTDANGKHVGLWYLDPYAREGKRSGAWMTDYRAQENVSRPVTPIVSNNSNFMKGAEGEAVLISWDDADTLFHEFGHALHGLLSHVVYRSQSGTNVARDYVEFPSQLNEHWLSTPEVLHRFCVHYRTGAPLPQELIDKIKRAETFNQGFATVEYLASALIDMKLHLAGNADIDPDRFERETLTELGMPSEIVMRHRTPHFQHIFADDGYSAGYYSYLWSDALTADAAEVFEQAGSFFDKRVAQSLHDHIMSVGDTIDPADGFRAFRGRDVDTAALLRKRGFPVD